MSPQSFEDAFAVVPRGDDGFEITLEGFGGVTLGCATLAVAASVPDQELHALHACFLRPVGGDAPCTGSIETLSAGRRFTRRRVRLDHRDRTCFEATASFAAASDGPDFSDLAQLDAPPPEELPSDREVFEAEGWDWEEGHEPLIEMRWVGRPWDLQGPAERSGYTAWVRPVTPPRTAAGRAAGIAFTSDFHSHWPVARMLGGEDLHFSAEGFVSLDQVIWIHRADAWDDWWLLTSWTDQGHGGRSLGHRSFRTRDGRLVASMAQEAMIPGARPAEPRSR